MTTPAKRELRWDLLKLGGAIATLLGICALFLVAPGFFAPALLSLVASLMISPVVAVLERKGYPRTWAIITLFGTLGLASVLLGLWLVNSGDLEWDALKNRAPQYYAQALEKIGKFESSLQKKFTFLEAVHLTQGIATYIESTQKWVIIHGPKLMGQILTWVFLVPFLTFILLNEGRVLRKKIFQLVPNRFFEPTFRVVHQISSSLSDYLRAKIIEALLVGLMTTFGLALIGFPYIVVLGLLAAMTNIIPYLGPILGIIPAVLIALLDPSAQGLIVPLVMVYVAVNVIDTALIFPLIVAKLVKLHPAILIAVVALGGRYYGLIGMVISVPIATAFKVVISELYYAIYQHRAPASAPELPHPDVKIADSA